MTVNMPLACSFLRSFSDMPDSRLSSSFSMACLRQRAWNSHWPQCRFRTRSGGELSAKSAVMSLIRFCTSLARDRSLHLQRGVAVAMHDLTESYLASDRFGQHERVEREQQLVLFGEFVSEFKTIWDKLRSTAPTFGRDPFNDLQARFQIVRLQAHVDSNAPSRVLGILRNGRPDRAVAFGEASRANV